VPNTGYVLSFVREFEDTRGQLLLQYFPRGTFVRVWIPCIKVLMQFLVLFKVAVKILHLHSRGSIQETK